MNVDIPRKLFIAYSKRKYEEKPHKDLPVIVRQPRRDRRPAKNVACLFLSKNNTLLFKFQWLISCSSCVGASRGCSNLKKSFCARWRQIFHKTRSSQGSFPPVSAQMMSAFYPEFSIRSGTRCLPVVLLNIFSLLIFYPPNPDQAHEHTAASKPTLVCRS